MGEGAEMKKRIDSSMKAKLSIPVRREYLDKKECLREAHRLKHDGMIHGMSKKQIAREIYFHAVMFHYCNRTNRHGWWREHADPINLHDGGDTLLRRAAYAVCWIMKRNKTYE